MLDLQALALDPAQGHRLDVADYKQDFRQRRGEVQKLDSWKLERQQHFMELNNPSWDAFHRGEWDEALRLLADKRAEVRSLVQADRNRGSVFHRVRVVEQPLTPYLQWELNSLRVRAESGMPIRVIEGEKVRHLEAAGPLPEMVSLGSRTLYNVRYTDAGVLEGAIRYTDPDLVERWTRFIKELYEDGEDLIPYVEREVAHLPAPQVGAE
ncbi:DUF6879 family protein [Streptomyces litchfieldiae]|uniref:DUF6879 domain-containing protein n=1 Tax=Streptomyces litchfieldiae TaxID=3075543 RepID=A0ABU2MKW9_9ACTN|nr:DUF6879 family protein [Streptomyces sp. DSM 44938]MDT0342261.1 hypothetical protein [Streptomyces sp. DSM 44938]